MALNRSCRRPTGSVGRLLALVLAMVLTACSTSDSASPTTLRVLMTDDWLTPPVLDAVHDFEAAHPQVRVVVDRRPIRGMLSAVKDSPSPPDVVQAHAFSAAAQGLAEPLDDLWAKYLKADDYFPGALDDVTLNGRRYGVPLDTSALVLLYNADHFKEAGIAPPSGSMTFRQLETMARALSTPDGSRRAIALGTSTWQTFGWVAANGGEYVKVGPDGKPEFLFDSPPVVGAIGFLASLVDQGLAIPPRAADSHSADVYALFESGVTSMYTTGSWDIAALRKSHPGVDYRAAPMPRGMAGTTQGSAIGGSSLFVPKGSANRKLAFDFMVHLTSDRYALRLAKEQGRLPVRARVYGDPFFQDPVIQVVLGQLKSARPERIDSFPAAGLLLGQALDQALREHRDPVTALRVAQQAARASVGSS